MLSLTPFFNLLALGLFAKLVQVIFFKSSRRFPPGPKALPILGNLLDFPAEDRDTVFAQWTEKYGAITYLDYLGTPYYVLHELQDASELFEKQGAKSSSRPHLVMCGELLAWNETLIMGPYNERWRDGRKLLHQYIGGRGQLDATLMKFGELEETETRLSLRRILKEPHNLEPNLRKTAGAIILKMTYGFNVKEGRDELVETIEKAMEGFATTGVPGAYLVDVMPFLKYIPAWFPGAEWKRKAEMWRALTMSVIHDPYNMVKKELAAGVAGDNFVTRNQDFATDEKHEYTLKTTAVALYAGGADTSVAAIYSFFMAMTLYPEVQRRAQAELDSVVGTDRLPTFQDRAQLPYVRAIVSEVMRWMPVVPFVFRTITEDTNFKGYDITAGSIIQANVRQYLHDAKVYRDPDVFRPERFLRTDAHEPERDPRAAVFGFGRRMCPGLNIAEASIFISCAMYLAVFDISKAVVNGIEVTPRAAVVDGMVSHPQDFECTIKPRSPKAEALILGSV